MYSLSIIGSSSNKEHGGLSRLRVDFTKVHIDGDLSALYPYRENLVQFLSCKKAWVHLGSKLTKVPFGEILFTQIWVKIVQNVHQLCPNVGLVGPPEFAICWNVYFLK